MAESVDEKSRLSGARGDFVASLGRRLQTLRAALRALEEQPESRERRNALLRRAHALGASARVLGFASVAEALGEAERAIAQSKGPRPTDLAEVSRVLDVVPSLVGGAPPSLRPPAPDRSGPEQLTGRQWPLSLLLFGGVDLEQELTQAVQRTNLEFERSEVVAEAAELARVLGPDLVLVDADAPAARDFFQRLIEDELTEPVKSILIGEFRDPNQPRELTVIGATRVLKKPVGHDTLRRTIEELTESPLETGDERRPLGDLTVKGLCLRLSEELDRGLAQAALPGTRATHVPFGEGTDVLAALWGSVTRVRELVAMHSKGAVRFEPTGPEGAIPLAPWIESERRAGDRGTKGGRDEAGVSLTGRTVLVADDDSAVTWFLSGLLRTVGAEVIEAYDGVSALNMVRSRWPDLVVSDIVMPKLDGFALCREIKRDVAIRDTPVILLSWKEDLLQRMRELGANADGYLKKEAEASTVVQRIREVMRPRARVEARVSRGGDVRGRLDGLTPRLILELCCASNENLRIEFRDAFFVYSMQVRRGRLVAAHRQAPDGKAMQGADVIKSVLGVNAGRFLVVPDASTVAAEFSGDLKQVLAPAINHARSCLWALSHERLPSVERIEMVAEEVDTYLRATPEPAQTVLRLVADGSRPQDVMLSGAAPPELVLHALADLARRGVIERVVRQGGESEPPPPSSSGPSTQDASSSQAHAPSVEHTQGVSVARRAMPPAPKFEARGDTRDVAAPSGQQNANPPEGRSEAPSLTPGAEAAPEPIVSPETAPAPVSPSETATDKPVVEEITMNQADPSARPPLTQPSAFTFQLSPEPPEVAPRERTASGVDLAAGRAGDDVDDGWFASPLDASPGDSSLVELANAVSEAPTRTPPPAAPVGSPQSPDPLAPTVAAARKLPSPIAIVDTGDSEEPPIAGTETPTSGQQLSALIAESAAEAPSPEPAKAKAPEPIGLLPRTKPLSFPQKSAMVPEPSDAEPPSVRDEAPTSPARQMQLDESVREDSIPSPSPSPRQIDEAPARPLGAAERRVVEEPISAPAREQAESRDVSTEPKDTSTFKVIGYALVAMVFSYIAMSALVSWLSDPADPDEAVVASTQTIEPKVSAGSPKPMATQAPAESPKPAKKIAPKVAAAGEKVAIETLPLPAGLALGADKGVLKIVTPDAHTLYVDGEFAGRGPVRIVPLPPGKHAVKTRFDGEEKSYDASVEAGRMTRLTISKGE